MRKTTVRAAIAALLLLSAPLFADVTETFDRTVALAAGGELAISNVNGSIEISAWNREEVQVRAVKSAKTAEALREVEVEVSASGSSVKIETHLPEGWNKGGSVSYEVVVPASARVAAKTVNGSVRTDGVRGALDVESVNGKVQVAGAASSTRAKTVNGPLTVRYVAAPESGSTALKSVNGAVRLELPPTVVGAFEAKTVNGSIRTDFPLEVKKARFGPTSSLDGAIGSGGASYEIETVNGSIRISNAAMAAR